MYRQDAARFNSVVNDGWEMFFEAVKANVKANSILKWIKVRNCSYKPDITGDRAGPRCCRVWGRKGAGFSFFLIRKLGSATTLVWSWVPGENFGRNEGSFPTRPRATLTWSSAPLGAAWERKRPCTEASRAFGKSDLCVLGFQRA